jgi:hypothetical protein
VHLGRIALLVERGIQYAVGDLQGIAAIVGVP